MVIGILLWAREKIYKISRRISSSIKYLLQVIRVYSAIHSIKGGKITNRKIENLWLIFIVIDLMDR